MTCCMPHSASDHNFDKNAIFSPRHGDTSSLDLPHISEREGKIYPSSYTEVSIRGDSVFHVLTIMKQRVACFQVQEAGLK